MAWLVSGRCGRLCLCVWLGRETGHNKTWETGHNKKCVTGLNNAITGGAFWRALVS